MGGRVVIPEEPLEKSHEHRKYMAFYFPGLIEILYYVIWSGIAYITKEHGEAR